LVKIVKSDYNAWTGPYKKTRSLVSPKMGHHIIITDFAKRISWSYRFTKRYGMCNMRQ
jgi:hypothetical protein